MSASLFISEQYIKDTSIIDENVDDKYIQQTIVEVQDIYIKPILGSALFDQIDAQIAAANISAVNTTLLNTYIQPVIKHYVLYEGMDLFTFKVTNKSIMKKKSDNSDPVETNDVERLMEKYKNKAELYAQRLTNYLIANSSTFTLFLNPGTSIDTIHPNVNNYSTGWVLDDLDDNINGMFNEPRRNC